MNTKITTLFKNASADIPAAAVVFLVALPMSLGIALGSGAPLFSGLIAGIIGGIVVGFISGSQLSITGPAAGLTVIVASALGKLPGYEAFLLAVIIAGVLQIILGKLKAGIIGDFVPSAVIKGMLAAIGIILILKQIPHLVGYDADFIGDETFTQLDGENTFTEMFYSVYNLSFGAVVIGICSLLFLILWYKINNKNKVLQLIPAPLIVVLLAIVANQLLTVYKPELALDGKHLVILPIANSITAFSSFFIFPKLSYLVLPQVWLTGLTLAVVASLETLLGLEAVDNLDPYKRVSPPNRELKAQGIGNIISGLLGGLPVTTVIVRSSVNINAGAKTKLSAILQGIFLLVAVLLIPHLLNKIPLASLAAILIFVGYKLCKPSLFITYYKKGIDQLLPFLVTIVAILLTDLLIGILIGIAAGLFFITLTNFKTAILVVHDADKYLVRLRKDVSFLNKPIIKEQLENIPENSFVIIDVTRADFIDQDIIEVVNDFIQHAALKNIKVEVKKDVTDKHKLFTEISFEKA